MDQQTTLARHFARLVWLLVEQPANQDEQKGALRAVITVSREGAVTLALADGQVHANGSLLPTAFSGAAELAAGLARHGITALRLDPAAAAADLLNVARLLASANEESGAATTLRFAQAVGLRTIQIEVSGGAVSEKPNGAVPPAPTAAPGAANGAEPTPAASLTEFELTEAPASRQQGRSTPAEAPEPSANDEVSILFREGGGMFQHFASASRPIDPADVLFARIDKATSAAALGQPLEELTSLAEQTGREGRAVVMADVLAGLVQREARATDEAIRRNLAIAINRLSTPFFLQAVAGLLPGVHGKADDYRAVLVRAGERGADAIIEQLTEARTADERRLYFDVLITLGVGVGALVHMLGDPRWFVVRNAAELLGELRAAEAEAALIPLLRHGDTRIRRAASVALMRIGEPRGVKAIEALLQDPRPEIRQEAAAAMAARRSISSSQQLLRALDVEEDFEVQLAMLAALGKVGSPDAVQRLARAAEPEGRLFRRKSAELRVAAVHALVEAKSPAALEVLATLREDKEKEVREAAARGLAASTAK